MVDLFMFVRGLLPDVLWVLYVVALYITLCTHVAEGASKRGRNYLIWAGYAAVATPVFAALSLWLIGSKADEGDGE